MISLAEFQKQDAVVNHEGENVDLQEVYDQLLDEQETAGQTGDHLAQATQRIAEFERNNPEFTAMVLKDDVAE